MIFPETSIYRLFSHDFPKDLHVKPPWFPGSQWPAMMTLSEEVFQVQNQANSKVVTGRLHRFHEVNWKGNYLLYWRNLTKLLNMAI